jgi:hypothetical protein
MLVVECRTYKGPNGNFHKEVYGLRRFVAIFACFFEFRAWRSSQRWRWQLPRSAAASRAGARGGDEFRIRHGDDFGASHLRINRMWAKASDLLVMKPERWKVFGD